MRFIKRSEIEIREYQTEVVNAILAREHNVGLIMSTGSGKTMVAFFLSEYFIDYGKILFLAPTTTLVSQIHKDACAFTNLKPESDLFLITGETNVNQRQLMWQHGRFFVATPQTAWNEIQNEKLNLADFSLVIVDELHVAADSYDYVKIANQAAYLNADKRGKIRLIGLTASVGGSEEKIDRVMKNLRLESLEYVDSVQRFECKETVKDIETDDFINRGEELINHRLMVLFRYFRRYGFISGEPRILSIKEMKTMNEVIRKECLKYDCPGAKDPISYGAEYFKLRHALSLIITENYVAACNFLKKVHGDMKKKKACDRIFRNSELLPLWYEIRSRFESGELHPKIVRMLKLFEVITPLFPVNFKAVIFCNNKDSQSGVLQALEKSPFAGKTRVIYSKDSKKGKQSNQAIIKAFNAGEFNFLISTSILEAGIHIPDLDFIVNYSIPPDEKTTIQRRGRVGRTKEGWIYYLAMNHPFDKSLVYANFAKISKMGKVLEEKIMMQDDQLSLPPPIVRPYLKPGTQLKLKFD
jgi:ERCC4-related helicase